MRLCLPVLAIAGTILLAYGAVIVRSSIAAAAFLDETLHR